MRLVSSPINISGQTTPPANAGQGSVASSDKIGSAEFGSLFAVLLGLTAPSAEGTKIAATTAPTTPEQPINPEISAELLNLQASLNTQATPGEQNPTITKALTDLLAAIEKLANAEANGEPVDPELVAIATTALETLAAALPATGTAVAAAASAAGATTNAAGSTSPLPLLDAEQSQAPILPQSANAESKEAASAKPAATEAAKPTAESQALLAKLTQIAGKLSEPLPALADKLQQLAQKLTDLAPTTTARNIAGPAPTLPTTPLEGEIANTVSTLFGSKEVGTPKTTQAGTQTASASAEQSAPVEETSSKATGPTRTLTGAGRPAENNIPGTQVERGTPQATPSANSAALIAAAAPLSQTSAATEADPLLYIQSNGQLAMRGEALGGIKAATAPYQQASQNLNLPHIAYEFARHAQAGVSRFQIRLNPPEMGKIDVKMDIDSTGALNARLTVERPETLDILQRDARALERALSQAGLDSSRTNLEFTLKQNPFSGQDGQFAGGDEHNSHSPFAGDDGDEPMAAANIPGAMMYSGTASPGGINMLA